MGRYRISRVSGVVAMKPADMGALRRRLAEMGIELAGSASYMETTLNHDLSKPHAVIDLERVAGIMPAYRVAGFIDCLACDALLFVSPSAELFIMQHDALPICRECSPADVGMTPEVREFGNRPPSADYIRDLLRGM